MPLLFNSLRTYNATEVFIHRIISALFLCRLSFATDIARGMSYLHQHKLFHGRLHSRNCVIDDRWVCKISGSNALTTPLAPTNLQARLRLPLCRLMKKKKQCKKVHQGHYGLFSDLFFLDYGLAFYRKEDFGGGSHDFNYGDINRVYIAPEVLLGSSSNMTAAADVYRCDRVSCSCSSTYITFWKRNHFGAVNVVIFCTFNSNFPLLFHSFPQLLHDSG